MELPKRRRGLTALRIPNGAEALRHCASQTAQEHGASAPVSRQLLPVVTSWPNVATEKRRENGPEIRALAGFVLFPAKEERC